MPPEHMWFYRQFEENTNNNPDIFDYEYGLHYFSVIIILYKEHFK